MLTYDPLRSPFELPIELFEVHCALERELVLPEREGASLHTTLRGAFGRALVAEGCLAARSGQTCIDRQGRQGCERAGSCALPWLHEPHVSSQRRDHPSPVVLRILGADFEFTGEAVAVYGFQLSLLLLGRHATGARELVQRALERTGALGLIEPSTAAHGDQGSNSRATGASVRLSATAEPVFAGALSDWVALRVGAEPPESIELELATPLVANPPDFGSLLGNVAHDLVQWDLADCGLSESWGDAAKQRCDQHGDGARATVRELAHGLVEKSDTAKVELGRRRSASTQQRFPLDAQGAFTGWLRLHGELDRVLPWLVVLELRGGGAKKSFGMGDVRLRFE